MKKKRNYQKWIRLVALLCILILVIEGIYLLFLAKKKDESTIYTDTASSFLQTSNAIYVVGSSDFRYGKIPYTNGLQKAKFSKYDQSGKLLYEKSYQKGFNSIYNSICEVEDGLIAVGHYEKTEQDQKEKTGPGLIVKYDSNGKVIYEKKISILADTNFTKVKAIQDGYIVIGKSIFENMTLGIDERGGGQMIRFDKEGNEIWRTNYGGSKSGIFNDLVINEEENSIYVVGKDAARTGVFMKYRLSDGQMEFVKNYSNTDNIGFSSIAKIDDDYVVGSSKKLSEDRESYQTRALLIRYHSDGEIVFEKQFSYNEMSRINSVLVKDHQIYAVGHSASLNQEKSTKTTRSFDYSGIYLQLSDNGDVLQRKEYKEKNASTYMSEIQKMKKKFLIVGQSNAKSFSSNQKDLKSYILTIDEKGQKEKQF